MVDMLPDMFFFKPEEWDAIEKWAREHLRLLSDSYKKAKSNEEKMAIMEKAVIPLHIHRTITQRDVIKESVVQGFFR
jgi:hypothetical protein